jgi:hypothetical protein
MKFLFILISFLVFSFFTTSSKAQFRTNAQNLVLTNEDSLNYGANQNKTVISGYGDAFYQRDFNKQQSKASLERVVLFVGHRFNEKISVFTEMELENAVVASSGEGNNTGGEISMEQAFLKFNLNARQYIVAGLFLPRIGILNENHLPVNFNGVERPMVETLVIPATWRELGVAFYGTLNNLPLTYDVGLMNGLNSANFQHGTGFREGRAEGSNAFANNLAVTAAVQYNVSDFKFQVSGYAGGTVGLNQHSADSLGLDNGAFGTPLYLGEADIQYVKNGVSAKILGTYVSYPDADKVNVAYAKNTGSAMYGAYAEVAYDWLFKKQKTAQFITFVRGEMLDLNSSLPPEPKGIYDGTQKQTHIIAGFSYLPIPNVVIKADVRLLHTGPQNPELVINPAPNAIPYKQDNQFLNIGIGYSF